MVCLLSLLHFPAFAMPQHWSARVTQVSNAPKTIISLRMQQIHSFNIFLDPAIWQLKEIQTFEDRDRYEFSKNFSCISKQCKPNTMLSITFVTYKYGFKIYYPADLQKHYPLSKWRDVFRSGLGITAQFREELSVRDKMQIACYGYRYHKLKLKEKSVNGLLDLLYYGQSQVRFMINSPKTEQKTLKQMLTKIESSIALQNLR